MDRYESQFQLNKFNSSKDVNRFTLELTEAFLCQKLMRVNFSLKTLMRYVSTHLLLIGIIRGVFEFSTAGNKRVFTVCYNTECMTT